MRLLRLMDVYIPLTGQGGYIPQNENGIVNLIGSRMYKPYFKPLAFMEKMKIRRIKRQIRTIRSEKQASPHRVVAHIII